MFDSLDCMEGKLEKLGFVAATCNSTFTYGSLLSTFDRPSRDDHISILCDLLKEQSYRQRNS